MERQSIDIIGPYPPPLGGISIHIFRLTRILIEERIHFRVFNHGFSAGDNVIPTKKSLAWYLIYLFKRKARIIHFHQFFSFHYVYFYILSHTTNSKLIVTIHEEKIMYQSKAVRNFLLFFIRNSKFSNLVSVSEKLSLYLSQKGIENVLLPAYVPPVKGSYTKFDLNGEKDLFIYSIWKLERGIAQKVYNIELAFGLLKNLQDRFHMLFLIGSKNESDSVYLEDLIEQFSVRNSVSVLYEKQLVDYLPNCKFLLRTNNEDGFGVSLQESLDLRIPAIASDVCSRPKGTILFRKGDLADLTDKVLNVKKYWMENLVERPRYHEELISIYKYNLL